MAGPRPRVVLAILFSCAGSASAQIVRAEYSVPSDPGIRLFVREVRREAPEAKRLPVLLLHGARVPGVASFDLPVPNGSLAADLAERVVSSARCWRSSARTSTARACRPRRR